MINEKFREVLKHEGVVTILSWGATPEPHLVNTWNSYLEITQDGKILVPAFGFRQTEKNVNANPTVPLATGTKEVLGYKAYPGPGFIVEGTAHFLSEGPEFDLMKKKLTFPNRVMEITIETCTQKI